MKSKLRSSAILALSVVLAACGSSPNSSTSATSMASTTTSGATPSSSPTPSSAGAVSIGTEQSRYGTVLEANGKTLYALSSDSATTSRCTGACATAWPPLTVKAAPTFGTGVGEATFGHLSRPDGSQQLTDGGHPLYWFARDTAAGQTNGQGINAFGGIWHVVSASTGQPVTGSASGGATSGSTTSTSSGAY